MAMRSSKNIPRGRHLVADHEVYDIDARLEGEERPLLPDKLIIRGANDRSLILGHRAAISNTYMCFGSLYGGIHVFKRGNRLCNSGLHDQTKFVTDMAFFAEDVDVLASVSVDGCVCVWKISEVEGKYMPRVSGELVIGVHLTGDEGSLHPLVCWHCHHQEILVVAIRKRVLRIDTSKVGQMVEFAVKGPLECPLDKLVDGIQLVGTHEGEVTDLSMCQWTSMIYHLVSASKDGTIKIWEDSKATPLLVLRPHDGQPVDSAKFLVAPHQPGHIELVTAGPLNREVKLWASSDAQSWYCTQTLELRSSAAGRNEDAFFNHLVLSQAGLLLLANSKNTAIYAIHLAYDAYPARTRMDFLVEFNTSMCILSFASISDISSHGEQLLQLFCIQPSAINQYTLDPLDCVPPLCQNIGSEKLKSSNSVEEEDEPKDEPPSLENIKECLPPLCQNIGSEKLTSSNSVEEEDEPKDEPPSMENIKEVQPCEPMTELLRLISQEKFEEAFTEALERRDLHIVSWLCSQVDLQHLLSTMPLPLSQVVLVCLLQQLSFDMTADTHRRLRWLTYITPRIIPGDPSLLVGAGRQILEQVEENLNHLEAVYEVQDNQDNDSLLTIHRVRQAINSKLEM